MELNFNSVETIPSLNASAAFQVDSGKVFKEDTDIVPVIIDDSLSYIPWGGDNMMPYNILKLIEDDETLSTCQQFNAEVCYGSGLKYDTEACTATVKQQVEDFLLDNALPSYFLGVCQDFKHFAFCVSVIILNTDGKFHDLAATAGGSDSGSTAQSGNIVMEIMFGNENRIITAEELVTLVSQVLAGKNIVCISNNNWGTNNERRIAFVTRINGFEVADGVVTISDTLNLNFSNCQDFDLDTVYFIKQVDGSYKMQYEFSK